MTKLHARGCSRYTQKQRRHPSTSSTHCTTILRLSFSPLVFFRALLQGVEPAATHSVSHKHADACFGVEESIRDAFTWPGLSFQSFLFFFFCKRFPLCMQAKVRRYMSITLENGLHLLLLRAGQRQACTLFS